MDRTNRRRKALKLKVLTAVNTFASPRGTILRNTERAVDSQWHHPSRGRSANAAGIASRVPTVVTTTGPEGPSVYGPKTDRWP